MLTPSLLELDSPTDLARPVLGHSSLLTELSEAERSRALERFRVLRPCEEDGVALAKLARAHELRLRTVQRWLHAYRQGGLVGLARKPRNDRRHRLVSAEFEQLIEGLALRRPPLSVCSARTRSGPQPSMGPK